MWSIPLTQSMDIPWIGDCLWKVCFYMWLQPILGALSYLSFQREEEYIALHLLSSSSVLSMKGRLEA